MTVLKMLLMCLLLSAVFGPPLGVWADELEPRAQAAQQSQGETAAAPPERVSVPPAAAVVEKLHAALMDVMKNAEALGYEGRYAKLAPVLEESFDLPFMANKSVGRHWKKMTEEEKARWIEAFRRLTTATYAGRLDGYSGEDFETHSEEPAIHDTMMVLTTMTRPGDEDVQLNYRLRKADDTWKIIDIYLDGTVSELALRRSEYCTVLKREGFEELISTVNAKVTDLAKHATCVACAPETQSD